MRTIPIILFLVFTAKAQSAELCTANPVVSNPLDELAKTNLKVAQIAYAKNNMKDFCQRNMLLRFLNVKKVAPKDCDKKTTAELELLARQTVTDKDELWDLGLIPTAETTQKSIIKTFDTLRYTNKDFHKQVDEFAAKLKSEPFVDFVADTKLRKNLRLYNADTSNDSSVDGAVNNVKLAGVCGELSLIKSISCVSATKNLVKKITPKAETLKLTNMDLWEDVMTTSQYDDGILLTAKKMVRRLKDDIGPTDNIYTDFFESFKESGMTPEKAKGASMKLMGLISNGANNTIGRFYSLRGGIPNVMKDQSLSIIGSSLQYLDYKKSQKNQPSYSLPEGVDSKCLLSKYHHFWMSAYLGWSLVNEAKVDPDVAAMAVFTVQKGYQINRDIGRPKVEQAQKIGSVATVLGKESFDPVHQIVRTDLALASAGGFWGASNMKKKINVDKTIVEVLTAAKQKEPLSKVERSEMNQLSLYNHWSEIFSPNTAFKSVDSQ